MNKGTTSPDQSRAPTTLILGVLGVLLFLCIALEFTRLLVTYSAMKTGTSEAVGYGVQPGVKTDNTPYYQDCDGMRAVSMRAAPLGGYSENDVAVSVLNGQSQQDATEMNGCAVAPAESGARLRVRIQTAFQLLPGIDLFSIPLSADSEVALVVMPTLPVSPTEAPTAVPTLTPSPPPVLTPTFTVTATPTAAETQTPNAAAGQVSPSPTVIALPPTASPEEVILPTPTFFLQPQVPPRPTPTGH